VIARDGNASQQLRNSFIPCAVARMGTAIRILLGTYTICNVRTELLHAVVITS